MNDLAFISQFHVSWHQFEIIMQNVIPANPEFYNNNCDAKRASGVCIQAKIMMAMKLLAYGAPPSAWRDYFQMLAPLSHKCLTEFAFIKMNTCAIHHFQMSKPF